MKTASRAVSRSRADTRCSTTALESLSYGSPHGPMISARTAEGSTAVRNRSKRSSKGSASSSHDRTESRHATLPTAGSSPW